MYVCVCMCVCVFVCVCVCVCMCVCVCVNRYRQRNLEYHQFACIFGPSFNHYVAYHHHTLMILSDMSELRQRMHGSLHCSPYMHAQEGLRIYDDHAQFKTRLHVLTK